MTLENAESLASSNTQPDTAHAKLYSDAYETGSKHQQRPHHHSANYEADVRAARDAWAKWKSNDPRDWDRALDEKERITRHDPQAWKDAMRQLDREADEAKRAQQLSQMEAQNALPHRHPEPLHVPEYCPEQAPMPGRVPQMEPNYQVPDAREFPQEVVPPPQQFYRPMEQAPPPAIRPVPWQNYDEAPPGAYYVPQNRFPPNYYACEQGAPYCYQNENPGWIGPALGATTGILLDRHHPLTGALAGGVMGYVIQGLGRGRF